MIDRRRFLAAGSLALLGACTRSAPSTSGASAAAAEAGPLYRISLAEWSVNRRIHRREEPALDHLDFPAYARSLGIDAVEYVSTLFADRSTAGDYVADLRRRCDGEGVRSLLIMVDAEGALGDPDEAGRLRAVANHHRWLDAAKALGCHAIRVNAQSSGARDEQARLAADGLHRLASDAASRDLSVIVENHGGLSSDGSWLAEVMRLADHPGVGTLPDFGNFNLGDGKTYDRYRGTEELMPFARAVSAKSYAFDEAGNETTIDYERMMRIVVDAGYRGHVGIEFEGGGSSEAGILATKRLLESVRTKLEAGRG
ncbi:MAG: sugar phosphate isomerase/epimerase family protein [Planctomycetota bacterium]